MKTKTNLFRLTRAIARTMGKTTWHFQGRNAIRTIGKNSNSLCPLAIVGNLPKSQPRNVVVFGQKIGFSDIETICLISAADYPVFPNGVFPNGDINIKHMKLRRILLRAGELKVQ